GSRPSIVPIRDPSARSTKKGSPPTPRKARTGEFTPPGIRVCAILKRSEEREFKKANVQRPTFNVQRSIEDGALQKRSPRQASILSPSALDTSAATLILSARAVWRGSQVVRSRSAKPLFAGSIPAPASLLLIKRYLKR